MTRTELLAFMRRYRVALQASVGADGSPQAAIVDVAVGDDFELVFDTLAAGAIRSGLAWVP